MKKIFLFLFIILVSSIFLQGKIVGILPVDYLKLPIIRVDRQNVYVVDKLRKKGFIFERERLGKIIEFGGQGQGPNEYTGISDFEIDDKFLYVSGVSKIGIYSKKGKLVKEVKKTGSIYHLVPVGTSFVGLQKIPMGKWAKNLKDQFRLFDENLQKKKDLFITSFPAYVRFDKNGKRILQYIRHSCKAFVYEDKIIIGSTEKGFYFSVYDRDGNMLYEISKDYKKSEFPNALKQRILNSMNKSGNERWKSANKHVEIEFPDVFPAYKTFFVNDGKIYVFCHQEQDVHNTVIIMDLKGNTIAKKKAVLFNYDISSEYHYVLDGKLYLIKENEDEEFQLHEFDIMDFSNR